MKSKGTLVLIVLSLIAIYEIAQPARAAAHPSETGQPQFSMGPGISCRLAIRAQKQGQFPGTQGKWIPCTQFLMTLTSSRDTATGLPSGRRQYTPIVITKEWDATSPLILTAAATNEALPVVEIDFIRGTPRGEQAGFETIKLTNASISSVKRYVGFPDNGEPPNPRPLEDIGFTFQRIEVTNNEGRTTFMDDWSAIR